MRHSVEFVSLLQSQVQILQERCRRFEDEIERLQTKLKASEELKRGYFDEIERLRASR